MRPDGTSEADIAQMEFALSQEVSTVLDRFRPESYEIRRIDKGADPQEYYRLLTEAYEPLGFMTQDILPSEKSERYQILYHGQVVAIFRMTAVEDKRSHYFNLVPGAMAGGLRRRLAEVNNVIIASDFRATILLGLIVYHSAWLAHRGDYDYVVGLTRHQTLRFFVDFGVIPVDHPPLHLLGKKHLLDFVIFFDTKSPKSVTYMHERAARYFHQQYVMKSLHEKYIKRILREPEHASTMPHFDPMAVAI